MKSAFAAAISPILCRTFVWAEEHQLTNWAGNYTYSTNRLTYAGSREEVINLVKKFDRLKVLGTRHCFNDIADSRYQLISLTRR